MTHAPTRFPQYTLPFRHDPGYLRTDFLWGPSNEDAHAWLAGELAWPQSRLALWGAPGSGKTHLLHLWAAGNGGSRLTGAALPEREPHAPVAIDDADQCTQPTQLLHLLNWCGEAGLPVLLAGRTPPARWPVALPDLASRLCAVTAVMIAPPGEAELRALLARLLAGRQLRVSPTQQEWLLLRLPRTAAAMQEAAAQLDQLTLAAKRAPDLAVLQTVVASVASEDFVSPPETPRVSDVLR